MFVVLAPQEAQHNAAGRVAGAVLVGATASENQTRSLVAGVVLVGPAASKDAEHSVARAGVLVRVIKRSHLLDDCPLRESQFMRHAMQAVANEYDQPVLFVSYADQAAHDERTGRPLAGGVYLASGFFYVGETTSQRRCAIDHLGRARSTRQGKITLTKKTLPKAGDTFHGEYITRDWRFSKLPPARIWIAPVVPQSYSRARAKHAWLNIWRSLNPARKVAAKKWISHTDWRRLLREEQTPLGEPKAEHLRELDRFQPAWWRGDEMTRTAAPVWVPLVWQARMLELTDVECETTSGRVYDPLLFEGL